jgi:hypothetical protein
MKALVTAIDADLDPRGEDSMLSRRMTSNFAWIPGGINEFWWQLYRRMLHAAHFFVCFQFLLSA